MTLADYIFKSKVILFIRSNIRYVMAFLFIVINWGHTLSALRAAYSIVFLTFISRPRTPQGIEHKAYYMEFYMRGEHVTIMALTLVNFGCIMCVSFVALWAIDRFLGYSQESQSQLRHLRKWTREKFTLLDKQARLLYTLDEAHKLNDKNVDIIKRKEAIILRYEKTSMALNPALPKRDKLSQKEETFRDLFDQEPDDEPSLKKAKRSAKKIIFNPK